MRKIVISIFISALIAQLAYSQEFIQNERHPLLGGKIAELEKIKLIETLNLDEETMLKFFSKRNSHHENIKNIMGEKDSLLMLLEKKLNSGNNEEFGLEIDKFIKIDKAIMNERVRFIKSLNEILTTTEIAKILVFEKNFRSEIRKEIIKQGKRRRGHD